MSLREFMEGPTSSSDDGTDVCRVCFGGELFRTHMNELLTSSGGENGGHGDGFVLPATLRAWLGGEPFYLALALSRNKTAGAARVGHSQWPNMGGLNFHQHGATLHLALSGASKRWLMYPPTNDIWRQAGTANQDFAGLSHADLTYGTLESDDGLERLTAPRSTQAWIDERLSELPPVARPFQCIMHAGDALYVPGACGVRICTKLLCLRCLKVLSRCATTVVRLQRCGPMPRLRKANLSRSHCEKGGLR